LVDGRWALIEVYREAALEIDHRPTANDQRSTPNTTAFFYFSLLPYFRENFPG